jgi:hypothetical protein
MALVLNNALAFDVLCLQAADEGRGEILFGDCLERVRREAPPFIIDGSFPSVYLEYPLIGDPFLDITILYNEGVAKGQRVNSPLVAGTEAAMDWFTNLDDGYEGISFGYELDTKDPSLPVAAIHFQPRRHRQLVDPFCQAVGEPERAHLYHEVNERLPPAWELSFFGMFRGRSNSPLRVCGYLHQQEIQACTDPKRLKSVFDAVGFTSYSKEMLEQATTLIDGAAQSADFQFDVYPDGTLGDTFAFDVSYNIQRPELVHENFENGKAAKLMRQLEEWGVADERWHLTSGATFSRAIPLEREDGSFGRYHFVVQPQWEKVRWTACKLMPAKSYLFATAGWMDESKAEGHQDDAMMS